MIAVALMLAVASATPSVADAERAFAAMAGRDGQWTAFRATAAPDAVMFVPGMVKAQDWLKGRADPPQAVAWLPASTLTACDGSLAVTAGPWTSSRGQGAFLTIWRATSGGWRWVLDQIHETPRPLPTPVASVDKRASCDDAAKAAGALTTAVVAADLVIQRDKAMPDQDRSSLPATLDEAWTRLSEGRSADGTLRWVVDGDAVSGRRMLVIHAWNGRVFDIARVELSMP